MCDESYPITKKPLKQGVILDSRRVLALLVITVFMVCLASVNYLLFHTIMELFCVVIAFCLSIIAYNTYNISHNFFFTFLGISYGFIGFFDFFHALAYKGMGIFTNNTSNLATQLWIIARLLDSISLFIATFFIGRNNIKRISAMLIGYGLISVSLILAIFVWDIFPDCYIEEKGLTYFKIVTEYLIIGILILSILAIKKKGMLLSHTIKVSLIQYALVTVAAEICFTLYTDVYGYTNMIGHIIKFIAYFWIYNVLFEFTFKYPYKILSEEIKFASQEIQTKTSQLDLQSKKCRAIEEEMSRLDKLHLVGEMAASIGHEIRNPLTTVRGYLQFFSRKPEFSHHSTNFNVMISELDRANSIITEFLSLAKDRNVNLQESTLNEVIQAILPIVKANALLRGCSIAVNLGVPLRLMLDDKLIRQLLLNMIQNGLDAMNNGGQLNISTFEQESEIILSIKDEGAGIAEHVLQKLGTPFLTTKPNGTGLGLAICYNIVNKHHAFIEVNSSPEGTDFIIHFQKPQQIEQNTAI